MRFWQAGLVVAAVLLIATPEGLDSCGIGPPTALFAPKTVPGDMAAFRAGKIGVLRRTFRQAYLIAAFRTVSRAPLTNAEAEALDPLFVSREDRYQRNGAFPSLFTSGRDAWDEQRRGWKGGAAAPAIESYKQINGNGLVYSFPNCLDPAFAVAADTLKYLRSTWGENDPRTVDWVHGQDQVFANCSGTEGVAMPEPAPARADPLLAAHRRYQIAAASFYAGQYRKASLAFEQIAGDKDSPWQSLGHYLSARALLRAGLIDGDMDAFREAKNRVLAVLNDPRDREWRDDGLALLRLWQLRVEPRARLAELTAELMHPRDEAPAQSMTDFLYIVNNRRNGTGRAWLPDEIADVETTNELAAWVMDLSEKPPVDAGDRALEWWRKTGKPLWLIPALMNAHEKNQTELLAAARKVPATDPAWESIAYYTVSGELARGHKDTARIWADRALAQNLQIATRNLILEERIKIARDFSEFLRSALRQPEPKVVLYDGFENPAEPAPDWAWRRVFDEDATQVFNTQLPLSLWVDASGDKTLPPNLRLAIAQCGWARALLLGRADEARTLLQRVVELNPAAEPVGRAVLNAQSPEAARFASVYIALRDPYLEPWLPGADDDGPDIARARYFGNPGWFHGGDPLQVQGNLAPLPFLPGPQQAANENEMKQLRAAEPWSLKYLLKQTMDWARSHPEDPRVPEALHRGVRRGYPYGGGSPAYGKTAKAAFEMLYQKYPKSPWTAKTPYWYN